MPIEVPGMKMLEQLVLNQIFASLLSETVGSWAINTGGRLKDIVAEIAGHKLAPTKTTAVERSVWISP